MRFNFKVSRLANQFFFISNLTEWHFSSRPSYNKAWLVKSGPLSLEEKKVLSAARGIIKSKLHYGRQFFFHSPRRAWREIRKKLTTDEYSTLRHAFVSFDRRFEKVWERKRLTRWKRDLAKAFGAENYRNFFQELESLFPARKPSFGSLTVQLLSCPVKDKHPAGGANLGNSAITLEVPVYNKEKWFLEAALAIVAHETAHLLLENSEMKRLLEVKLKRWRWPALGSIRPKRSPKETLREILIDAFVPFGYLSHKFLKEYAPLTRTSSFANLDRAFGEFLRFKEGRPIHFHWFETYFVWQFYPLAAYYVERHKALDRKFLEQMLKCLKVSR